MSSTIVGVDLGGTKILSRLVDPETGWSEGRVKRSTPRDGPDSVLDAVADVVREIDPDGEADAVGVGVPGLVEASGVVARCPNIAGWNQPVDVKKHLEKALRRSVSVGNDVNVGALAEHRVGAGKGVDNMAAVFVGTGVGGGIILNGEVVTGGRGMAGEIGHMTTHPGGRICGCGRRGHLEAYAGRAGIEREARRLQEMGRPSMLMDLVNDGAFKSRHLAKSVAENDPVALNLLEEAAEALAIGIGNLATVLDLERVVLGGGIMDRLGQDFVDDICQSTAFGGFGKEIVEIRLAQRIDDAGVVGAAILAAEDR